MRFKLTAKMAEITRQWAEVKAELALIDNLPCSVVSFDRVATLKERAARLVAMWPLLNSPSWYWTPTMSKPKRAADNSISRHVKFVPCEIDLAPSFATSDGKTYRELGLERGDGGYARVAVTQLYGPDTAIDKKSSLWRVSIWGADDTGYEQDVPSMDVALTIFNGVDWVYGLPAGFQYA